MLPEDSLRVMKDTMPTARSRSVPGTVVYSAAAAVVVLAAIFQNFYRLAVAPVLSDEMTYTDIGWRYAHWGSVSAAARAPLPSNFEHPPLAKLLFGAAQTLLGHPSMTAARAVSAACTVITAVVLAWWLGRVAGRWIGMLAGGMLALLPMAVDPVLTRFDRTAMLDPVAELFMVVSVVLAWVWFRSAGRRGWGLALLAGASVGLATASKENGFLGAVGPIALGMVLAVRTGGRFWLRLRQAASASVVAVLVFLACYLPFGDVFGRIDFLVRFGSIHSTGGHTLGYAGMVTAHPLWWANLWFARQGLGTALTWVLVATALSAVVLRHDRLVWWCVAALVGPFVFHCFVAGVVLPFYWAMWMPALIALSALGIGAIAALGRRPSPVPQRLMLRLVVAVAVLGVVVPSIAESVRVAGLVPLGAKVVPDLRAGLGLDGSILTAGTYPAELAPSMPGTSFLLAVPADLRRVDTVLVGQPRCRTLVDPGVRALVQKNVALGSMREAHSDRLLQVYVATGPLRAPTAAETAKEPTGKPTDNC